MKRMLISVDRDESRAAVVSNGQLQHLEIEPISRDSCKGNIYRGVIARVEPSLQSAFVDFGRNKQGFLPVGEIHPRFRADNKKTRAPIQDLIKAGQEILLQVVRDEIGSKGATLSTYISLPGRYLVLMPETDKSGVSRKLSDQARARVKEITQNMKVPEGFGLIVRTAGESATKLSLSRDLVYLNRLWQHIETKFEAGSGAEMLYHERPLAVRFVREYFTRDIEELIVDDEASLAEIAGYIKLLMPRNLAAIEGFSGAIPLFARYGIQGQVEAVFSRQVQLPSGGSIVIDQTEALVAVDVNSGRVKTKDIEETARATNIEAAQELARQLVLRDLGGLIVVDFIDMRERKYVREVEQVMKKSMKGDKARHKIGSISEFGLLELSRQRLKSSVNKGVFEPCKHCSATGSLRTTTAVASSIMRRIYEYIAQGEVRYIIAQVPPDVAGYLLNSKRLEMANVEREYHVSIEILAVPGLTASEIKIERLEKRLDKTQKTRVQEARYKRINQQLDLVRNQLVLREETGVNRLARNKLSGALVDFNEIYREVEKQTADVKSAEGDPEASSKARSRRGPRRGNQSREAASSAEAPVVVSGAKAQADGASGVGGWFKRVLGMTQQAQAVKPVETPAAEEKTVENRRDGADTDRSHERGSRRGRRGGRRRRGSRHEASGRNGGSNAARESARNDSSADAAERNSQADGDGSDARAKHGGRSSSGSRGGGRGRRSRQGRGGSASAPSDRKAEKAVTASPESTEKAAAPAKDRVAKSKSSTAKPAEDSSATNKAPSKAATSKSTSTAKQESEPTAKSASKAKTASKAKRAEKSSAKDSAEKTTSKKVTKAAKSKDSEVKLADATLLVRQEIERMKGKGTGSAKDGDKKAAGSKSEKSAEPSKKKAAAKSTKKANKSGVSDRFVVDLRSGESSQAGS